jgi:GH43 family beta-xylosidase
MPVANAAFVKSAATPILTTTLQPDVRPSTGNTTFEVRPRSTPKTGSKTFTNPIIPPASADPWVITHQGAYYYCESRNQNSIWIRKSDRLTEIGSEEGVQIWSAPQLGANSNAIWAPELHHVNGRWYIYYAADDGLNENHRMWVLESITDDPMGGYRCKGQIDTQGWAIDGTILHHNGELYFLWSGWPGAVNGRQNLYIAPMSNPWTVRGERTLLATPEHAWETHEMAICEGPQILQRHGKLFVIYSASGSWTTEYCLGMLEYKGGNICNAASWKKWEAPVFKRNARVWGVGHCSFTQSPDGTEDWILFHAKTRKKSGWNDRNVHAQRFTWTEAGDPFFGEPVPAGIKIPLPTGTFPAPVAA